MGDHGSRPQLYVTYMYLALPVAFLVAALHMEGVCGRRLHRGVSGWLRCFDCNAMPARAHARVVPDNRLGAEGMAALAPAIGNLVSLTSLDLHCT